MKWIFPAVVLALGTVPVGTNIFGTARTVTVYEDLPILPTCADITNVSPKLNKDAALQSYAIVHTSLVLYITRGSAIAADILVLALTWVKSFKHVWEIRRLKLASSLSVVLLRDGTIYFIALLIINILQLVTYSDSFSNITYVVGFVQFMVKISRTPDAAVLVDQTSSSIASSTGAALHAEPPPVQPLRWGEQFGHTSTFPSLQCEFQSDAL
ncbi:uncharacterized protein PHACADRAFT_207632 [Phanerochaete carnosa HHB-10118-sp]|uniref:Uncharacterized protein n=1 Tax=Phanerochaete carnosa (strain HHB-10118-sp) TaxID=650164 RepID=K5WBN6_PHACS|nr:uncharacterized protein PHACADRAFT_207632 [Phanerochaete carnosa HHB-10118-sp]EKM56379.1 hypothetical protein PHACADRAFT_207632 [Phanerochaete carnosa HHB-10118-sp]